jgi:hypothetical protein
MLGTYAFEKPLLGTGTDCDAQLPPEFVVRHMAATSGNFDSEPAASQTLAVPQDTLLNPSDAAIVDECQLLPPSDVAQIVGEEMPAARHDVDDPQASWSVSLLLVGIECVVQLLPPSALTRKLPSPRAPQAVEEEQVIQLRGNAVFVSVVQLRPAFVDRRRAPDVGEAPVAARHVVAVTHAMLGSTVNCGAKAPGSAVTFHSAPPSVVVASSGCSFDSFSPSTRHVVADGQASSSKASCESPSMKAPETGAKPAGSTVTFQEVPPFAVLAKASCARSLLTSRRAKQADDVGQAEPTDATVPGG